MSDWEINKPLGCCQGTGRKIASGEEYFAALVETPEGFQRHDFCEEYWQKEKPAVYCYWKSRLPDPQQKKQMFIDDDMLMAFFERLGRESEQEKVNFRFVLALILMRKRRLKYDSSKNDDGREIWNLRVVGSGDIVEVVNPHLDEGQIEQLSLQVGEILHADMID